VQSAVKTEFFQVEDYVKELNAADTRRGRKALEVNNVIYWFKNTRSRQNTISPFLSTFVRFSHNSV
jgi:hypothetical protein